MSDQILTAGVAAATVTSSAAVDLLSSSTSGIPVANVRSWILTVTTNNDITVSIYKAAGLNCGLVLVTTHAVTSSAPLSLEMIGECSQRLRVTAIASSTTATVNADFAGRS
jgi:hypothetical protein